MEKPFWLLSLLSLTVCPLVSSEDICPPGTKVQGYTVEGKLKCVVCTSGRYQPTETADNAAKCDPCPVGYYADKGSPVCSGCPPGKYQQLEAMRDCERCRRGHVQPNSFATKCGLCTENGVGWMANPERTTCTQTCPTGSYAGLIDCERCVKGKFLAVEGSLDITDCKYCPQGKFSEAGVAECEACPSGKFNPGVKLQCIDCAAGKYSRNNSDTCSLCSDLGLVSLKGQAVCEELCPAGTYNSSYACLNCLDGQYSLRGQPKECGDNCDDGSYHEPRLDAHLLASVLIQGTPHSKGACLTCPPGKWSRFDPNVGVNNDDKASGDATEDSDKKSTLIVRCTECPAGRYGSSYGLKGPDCDSPCAVKFYCPLGSTTGAQERCEEGWTSSPGARSIDDCYEIERCNIGYFLNQSLFAKTGSHQLACQRCAVGQYKDLKGDQACFNCERGKYSFRLGRNSTCPECPRGQYADRVGSTECKNCERGRYMNKEGGTSANECSSCMERGLTLSDGSVSPNQCICEEFYYMDTLIPNAPFRGKCVQCPEEGVDCDGSGNALRTMRIWPGYWRAYPNTMVLHECGDGVCVGTPEGYRGEDPAAVCAIGQTGPLCSVCKSGYARLTGAMCERCADATIMPLVRGAAAIAAIVGGVYIIFTIWQAIAKARGLKQSTDASGLAALFTTKGVTWIMKVKIIISFFQVVSSFGTIFTIKFPPIVLQYLFYFSWLNLDIMKYFATGCIIPRNYFVDVFIATMLPVGATLAIYGHLQYRTWHLRTANAIGRERKRHFAIFIAAMYFMYTGINQALFRVFQTRQYEDGHRYLIADMSMRTDSPFYKSMVGYTVFMILMFPLGIIALFLWVLWINKSFFWMYHRHNDYNDPHQVRPDYNNVLDSIEFLIGAYRGKYWWFEVFELARKLMLAGIFSLILPETDNQVALGNITTLLVFWVYVDLKPFRDPSDNTLAIFAQANVFLVLYCGLIYRLRDLYADDHKSHFADEFMLNYGLISMVVFFPLFGVFLICRDLCNKSKYQYEDDNVFSKKKKRKRGQLKFGDHRGTYHKADIKENAEEVLDDVCQAKFASSASYEVWVVVDPTKKFPTSKPFNLSLHDEGISVVLDMNTSHGVPNTVDWAWKGVRRFKGERQSEEAEVMELFHVQFEETIFCFEVDNAGEICTACKHYIAVNHKKEIAQRKREEKERKEREARERREEAEQEARMKKLEEMKAQGIDVENLEEDVIITEDVKPENFKDELLRKVAQALQDALEEHQSEREKNKDNPTISKPAKADSDDSSSDEDDEADEPAVIEQAEAVEQTTAEEVTLFRFKCYALKDPSEKLPDEVDLVIEHIGLKLWDEEEESQVPLMAWAWSNIDETKCLLSSEDDLDQFSVTVKEHGDFVFECENWSQIKRAIEAQKPAARVVV